MFDILRHDLLIIKTQQYNGTEVVRNIPCDVFLSCQKDYAGRTFIVKHYISSNLMFNFSSVKYLKFEKFC